MSAVKNVYDHVYVDGISDEELAKIREDNSLIDNKFKK